jgi:hypothetical protein
MKYFENPFCACSLTVKPCYSTRFLSDAVLSTTLTSKSSSTYFNLRTHGRMARISSRSPFVIQVALRTTEILAAAKGIITHRSPRLSLSPPHRRGNKRQLPNVKNMNCANQLHTNCTDTGRHHIVTQTINISALLCFPFSCLGPCCLCNASKTDVDTFHRFGSM